MHSIQRSILKVARHEDISQLGLRRLGQRIGEQHPQKVKYHLQKLLDSGRLRRDNQGNVYVADPRTQQGNMARIPVLGAANCGQALVFAEDMIQDFLSVSPSLVRGFKSTFAVKASGESMNEADVNGLSIDDGDYVIVDNDQADPRDGDYVLSTIDGLANIKRFFRDKASNCVMLVSQSSRELPPIVIDEADRDSYHVHGKVVRVIKPPKLR